MLQRSHSQNEESMDMQTLLYYFQKLSRPLQSSAATALIQQQPSRVRRNFPAAKFFNSLKTQLMVSIF